MRLRNQGEILEVKRRMNCVSIHGDGGKKTRFKQKSINSKEHRQNTEIEMNGIFAEKMLLDWKIMSEAYWRYIYRETEGSF